MAILASLLGILIVVPVAVTVATTARGWAYTSGRIAVDLDTKRESTNEFRELLSRGVLVADFRPSLERTAPFPSPLR